MHFKQLFVKNILSVLDLKVNDTIVLWVAIIK